MRPVLAVAALAALLLGSLAACSDDDPLRYGAGDNASFALRPQLSSFGAAEMLPINLIRLTVESHPDGEPVMDPVERAVVPTDSAWNLRLDVPLVGGQPIDVVVIIELINETAGVRTVEWSGSIGPLTLEPGRVDSPAEVPLFRGSRENLSITSVTIVGEVDTTPLEGVVMTLRATAEGASGEPQFFWSSLDTTIARIESAAGDSAVVRALLPGTVDIVVEAGPRADQLELVVQAAVAEIVVAPEADTADALGVQLLFGAEALDARGAPVAGVAFEWLSADSLVARSLGGGLFEAAGPGNVLVTATASGVAGSAALHVRQLVDSVDVTLPQPTVAAGATIGATAAAFDAGGNPIGAATFAWSVSDTALATIDAAGVVSAHRSGTVTVRAESGGIADSAALEIVAGAAATIAIVSGDEQSGTVAAALDAPLVVRIVDGLGNAVVGLDVSWDGDGTFAPASIATDANGEAATEWTLGTVAGAQVATATAGSLVATFNASAGPGAVDSVDVEPDTLMLTVVGETATLTASSFDEFGNECGCTATWQSRDDGVATVDGTGLVTAVATGSTWVVADIAGITDSAFVEVNAGGRVITWVGGVAAGQERAWERAENWSPAAVPTAIDGVVVPASAGLFPLLSGDATVATLFVESGATLELAAATLRVDGDIVASGPVTSTLGGVVVLAAPGSVQGTLPTLALEADGEAGGPVTTAGDLRIAGGTFAPTGAPTTINGALTVDGGTLELSLPGDGVHVVGDATFASGQPEGTLTDGSLFVGGDLTAVGACGEFVATGTEFVLTGDTSHVSLDCPGPSANRFHRLALAGGVDQSILFETHVVAREFSAVAGGAALELIGAGTSLSAQVLEIAGIGVQGLQLRHETASETDALSLSDVVFTGFGGSAETQLVVSRPGDAPILIEADFDETSSGAYISANDTDAAAPFLELHVVSADADGAARTLTDNGAVVWWNGQPHSVVAVGGDGQTGQEGQPLPDSLVVRVLDVFGTPVAGAFIDWAVTSGGGSISPDSSVTDAGGETAAEWVLGAAFTGQSASATVPGLGSATFGASSFGTAPGATIAWIGAASSDWFDGANWSTGIAPAALDTAYVDAGAPNQPVLAAPDSIAGLIVGPGATVDVSATTLTMGSYLLVDGQVTGTGSLRLRDVEVRHTESDGVVRLPSFEVAGESYLWNRVHAAGSVTVGANAYFELTVGGLQTTGDLTVAGDNAFLAVFDSLLVGGSLTVGGSETTDVAYLQNHESIVVGADLLVTGRGLLEFVDASNTMRILGSARWEGDLSGEGILPEGTIEVAGDWHMEGPSFHTPGLQLFFNGSAAVQTITHLDVGHGPGQGHFGPVHVSNPNGVVFSTPTLIRGSLTSDAGVPIVADTLIIEGDIVASGDVTAVELVASDVSVSGTLTAASLITSGIQSVGGFAVDSTVYVSESEIFTIPINSSVTYPTLTIDADSAMFDGPAAVAERLRVNGHLRLAGRTTVGGQVFVDGAGVLWLDGNALDATGGSVSIGTQTAGQGALLMTNPADSLIAEQVSLFGASTDGLLTAGTIIASGFSADGLSFHASGSHTVVLTPRGGVVTNQITTTAPSIEDGVGARFATLRIDSTAAEGLALNTDVAALHLVTDSTAGVLLTAAPGAQRAVIADSVRVYGATFRNVPLQVLGLAGALEIDNTAFEQFDAGTTQLEVTHDATEPFVFTGMSFDSLTTGDEPALYLRANRVGIIDAPLEIEVQATNVENGEAFTLENGFVDVTWPNDILRGPAPTTIAWTGETSADWFDASNWNEGRLPANEDIVWVFASAPNQPQIAQPDTIDGLYLEDAAQLALADSLVVTGTVQAGTTIIDIGAGVLHVVGELATDSISGVVPTLIADGVTFAGDSTLVTGSLTLRGPQGTFVNSPLHVTGDLFVEETAGVTSTVSVDGGIIIGNGRVGAGLLLMAGGSASAVDSVHVAAPGTLTLNDATSELSVIGDLRFETDFAAEGLQASGRIELGGDLFVVGPGLQSTGTELVLNGADGFAQVVVLDDAGTGPLQSRLGPVTVDNAQGVEFHARTWIDGDLTMTQPGATILAVDSVAVLGTLTSTGDVNIPVLEVKSLAVGGAYTVGTTVYVSEPGDPRLPVAAGVPYTDLVVAADSALTAGNVFVNGDFVVLGSDVMLGGTLDVSGLATIDGRVDFATHALNADSIAVVGGAGIVMEQAGSELHVTGAASFSGGTSTLSGGFVFVESGASFHSVGDAFASTGTVLHMRGASLDMENAGPEPGQGRLADLVLQTPALILDSAYVSGSVTDADSSVVGDAGNPGPWRAWLRVDGDLLTPRTSYGMSKISLAGELELDHNAMDVDSIEFTGSGQVIPVLVPGGFSPFPYSGTLVVSGTDVHLGADTAFLDLNDNVIVRGSGATLTVHSNDNGFIGSLHITEGDATTRIVIHDAISVSNTTVLDAGVLDLNGVELTLNNDGLAGSALITTTSGQVRLDEPLDQLRIAAGEAHFEAPGSESFLTSGTVVIESGAEFYSIGDGFRASGTALVHRGDSISMQNAGPGAGQGRLSYLLFDTPQLDVLDSLYIDGALEGTAGSMLHDPFPDDALVHVTGNAIVDSSQVILGNFAIGGALVLGGASNFGIADTTKFVGNSQYIPVANGGPSYGRVLMVTGTNADIGSSSEYLGIIGDLEVIVRGPGASANLWSNDGGGPGTLVMDGGADRVTLMSGIDVSDSVHIASGTLDLNGHGITPNDNALVRTSLRTSGSGVIEMVDPSDGIFIHAGDVFFEGGSTLGLLSAGTITLASSDTTNVPSFHATGAAFHSTGTYLRLDADSIVVVNGGVDADQARFAGITFGTQTGPFFTVQLDGDLVVADSIVDYIGSGSGLTGTETSSLTVLGLMRGSIARYDLPLLSASGHVEGARSSDIDVVELTGNGQVVRDFINLEFDTIRVTGAGVTIQVDTMAFPDTIARVIEVMGGVLTFAQGGSALVTDSLIVDGGTFNVNGNVVTIGDDIGRDGGFVTQNNGVFNMVSAQTSFVIVNGDAEFRGGQTGGLLTAGQLSVVGDFYAENGAFQASGTHETYLEGSGSTVNTPTPGEGSGLDHFNELHFAAGGVLTVLSDLYVLGDIVDNSDAFTDLDGSGQTIYSDGWNLNFGLADISDVTLELFDGIDPDSVGRVVVNGIGFGAYTVPMDRMRIIHQGFASPVAFTNMPIPSATGAGNYFFASDPDGANPDTIVIDVFYSGPPPVDFGSRVVAEPPAEIRLGAS